MSSYTYLRVQIGSLVLEAGVAEQELAYAAQQGVEGTRRLYFERLQRMAETAARRYVPKDNE